MKLLTWAAALICTLGLFGAFTFDGPPPSWYMSIWGIMAAFLLFVGTDTEQFYNHPMRLVRHQKLALTGSFLVAVGFLDLSLEIIPSVLQGLGAVVVIVIGVILSWLGHWMVRSGNNQQ